MDKEKLLIKVWGSIIEKSDNFSELIELLEEVSESTRLILTTGSKELSDVIREYIRWILPNWISVENHVDITMQSRDMVAQSFADLSDKFAAVWDMKDITPTIDSWRIPVLIQYPMLKVLQPFELRRGLSTDTTSAFFADVAWVDRFIKLTNVDGVYGDILKDSIPMERISTYDLKTKWRTCIDVTLAEYLEELDLKCFVVNGLNIENLRNFLYNRQAIQTCVYPLKKYYEHNEWMVPNKCESPSIQWWMKVSAMQRR